MREQFEKLPSIAVHLNHGNVFFSEDKQAYASEFSSLHFVACFVNGAWYAYQEQQKKIDAIIECVKNNTADYELDNKIKQLLK